MAVGAVATLVLARAGSTLGPSPTPSGGASTGPTGSGSGLVGLTHGSAVGLVVMSALALLAVLVAATWADLRYAKKVFDRRMELIEGMAKNHRPSLVEMKVLLGAVNRPVSGMQGLTRSLLSLSILVALMFALVATLTSAASDAVDLRKTLIASLTSIFATIVGFYFGSRTAQTTAESERASTEGPALTGSLAAAPRATSARAGQPGQVLPSGATPITNLADLRRAPTIAADPPAPWTAGSWIALADGSQAHWDGTQWQAGRAP